MDLRRIFRHLVLPDRWALRSFPVATQAVIERAITASEKTHLGELRFAVEAGLPLSSLLANQSSRARAIESFARLGVWDTEQNCGVLIYVQLVDRRVEIVADRGINARVEQNFWDSVCRDLEAAFRANQFESGVVAAIARISVCLQANFPALPNATDAANPSHNPNELPDRPITI